MGNANMSDEFTEWRCDICGEYQYTETVQELCERCLSACDSCDYRDDLEEW